MHVRGEVPNSIGLGNGPARIRRDLNDDLIYLVRVEEVSELRHVRKIRNIKFVAKSKIRHAVEGSGRSVNNASTRAPGGPGARGCLDVDVLGCSTGLVAEVDGALEVVDTREVGVSGFPSIASARK